MSSSSLTTDAALADRSVLLLGITAFLHKNPRLFRVFTTAHPEIEQIETESDREFLRFHDKIQKLYQDHPNGFSERPPAGANGYIELGDMAIARGVALNVLPSGYEHDAIGHIELLPPCVRQTWSHYEGTIDPAVLQDRYYVLAKWNRNSCAPDAVLCAGIYAKVAVQQVDVISWVDLRALSPVQIAFRELMCLPWGKLSQDERDAARDRWRELLLARDRPLQPVSAASPGKSCADGQQDVRDVVEWCFHDLPSFSYTVRPAIFCCLDGFKVRREARPTRRSVHWVPLTDTSTVGQILSDYYRAQPFEACASSSCSLDCGRPLQRVTLVLDRLPPMLAVCVATTTTLRHGMKIGVFEAIRVHFYVRRGQRQKRYIVAGVIFCTGTCHDHFVIRYRGRGKHRGKIVEYNSITGAEVKIVPNFYSGIIATDHIRVLFYRQYGS